MPDEVPLTKKKALSALQASAINFSASKITPLGLAKLSNPIGALISKSKSFSPAKFLRQLKSSSAIPLWQGKYSQSRLAK